MRILQIKVKPHARTSDLSELEDGSFLANVRALPIDGKANAELIGLIAKHFQVAKSAVSVKSGASGRLKLVTLADTTPKDRST